MILICTSCASRYFAADESIGEGRMVKCAACGHEWMAVLSLKLDHALDEDEPHRRVPKGFGGWLHGMRAHPHRAPVHSPAALIRARQAQREQRARLAQASGAWGGALILLAGIFAAGAAARDPLARIWPQSASLFTAAGLDVNIYGLIIEDVQTERTTTPQGEAIKVSGVVRNLRAQPRQTPPVRILWRDAQGRLLSDSLGHPEKSSLGGGKLTRFETIISGPATRAAMVEVRFGLIQGEELADLSGAKGQIRGHLTPALRR